MAAAATIYSTAGTTPGLTITLDISDPGALQTLSDGSTIVGVERIEVVTSSRNDRITGGELNDVIDALSGANLLFGGGGNDSLTSYADSNADVLDGGAGKADFASFGYAGRLNCTIDISDPAIEQRLPDGTTIKNIERMSFLGGSGDDAITGGKQRDYIAGRSGADRMAGKGGDDQYFVEDAGDRVLEAEGGGHDLVMADVSFSLAGGHVEELILRFGNVNGTGNHLDNRLTGSNDGVNRLEGRGGDDEYVVGNLKDKVIEFIGGGTDTIYSSVSFSLIGQNIENLTLLDEDPLYDAPAIFARGNSLSNILVGNSRGNVINGGGGPDQMRGGRGNDIYIIDSTSDILIEARFAGADWVHSPISYTLSGLFIENLKLTGADAINAIGNSYNNVMIGNTALNRLEGGHGNDTYVVQTLGDTVIERASGGIDLVRSSVSFDLAGQSLERLELTGTQDLNGKGNDLANHITGNSGKNLIDGRGGIDRMAGGRGDDTYVVQNSRDIVVEAASSGVDLVQSSVSFSLEGQAIEWLELKGAANINATGNGLHNAIEGNSGRNVITGGLAGDALSGNVDDAEDRFVYTRAADSGADLNTCDFIFDFDVKSSSGEATWDKIDLRVFDIDWSDISFFKSEGDVIVEIDLSGDDAAEMIIYVDAVGSMTSSDFLL